MLKNIGLLLLISFIFLALTFVVVSVFGLPFREASLATLAVLIVTALAFALKLAISISTTRTRAAATLEHMRRLRAEQQKALPEFLAAAERIQDPKARNEALAAIRQLESAAQSLALDAREPGLADAPRKSTER